MVSQRGPRDRSVTAPDSAPAGSTIAVDWTGPAAQFDYIALPDAGRGRVAEQAIGADDPVLLGLPWLTGAFTLTYVFEGSDEVFARPITLTEAAVAITVPETSQVGTDVTVTWIGPNADDDNIRFYRLADTERLTYGYLAGLDMTFTMPDDPGVYEFRYVFRDSEVIFTRPITVTLDQVDAAPVGGGSGSDRGPAGLCSGRSLNVGIRRNVCGLPESSACVAR
jgi:Ca-activated chloride channel family protein